MAIYGIEAEKHDLSYDIIIKETLADSDEMTIRFLSGLLGEDIPLDAKVEWLDKESYTRRRKKKKKKVVGSIVADFYPRVDGRMYAIEIEQDGKSGEMAVRVFRYAIGGAMLHSMTSTKAELNITFPQPCVVFLKSTDSTPEEITWSIDFYDGQKVKLQVPVIKLATLSVKEIAERHLLPIGQFYMRKFEPLSKKREKEFLDTAASLLTAIKSAVEDGDIPRYAGVQMEDNVRKTIENILVRYKQEVDVDMTTNIKETLPWTNYKKLFEDVERKMEEDISRKLEEKFEKEVQKRVNAAIADKDAIIARLMKQNENKTI